jgi:hypothetical protein
MHEEKLSSCQPQQIYQHFFTHMDLAPQKIAGTAATKDKAASDCLSRRLPSQLGKLYICSTHLECRGDWASGSISVWENASDLVWLKYWSWNFTFFKPDQALISRQI